MRLYHKVVAWLDAQEVSHALIGGMAMARHGYARATLDVDVMATHLEILDARFWEGFDESVEIERNRGDIWDPLAGVVRLAQEGELDVDIVLFGPLGWQAEVLSRAEGVPPAASLPDLILLKLYAGGPRDRADIHGLLDVLGESSVIDGLLKGASKPMLRRWAKLLAERSSNR